MLSNGPRTGSQGTAGICRHEFPNPERTGCPDPETLNSMSRRIIPMTQAQLHHVTHCSPCFRTFQAIRAEVRHKRRRSNSHYSCCLRRRHHCRRGRLLHWRRATHALSPNRRPCHSGHLRPSAANRESRFGTGTHQHTKASIDPSQKASATYSLSPGRGRRGPVLVAVARWPAAPPSRAALDRNAPGSHGDGGR